MDNMCWRRRMTLITPAHEVRPARWALAVLCEHLSTLEAHSGVRHPDCVIEDLGPVRPAQLGTCQSAMARQRLCICREAAMIASHMLNMAMFKIQRACSIFEKLVGATVL